MGNTDKKNEKKNVNKNESMLVTKESLCATCALFSFLALLILCSRSLLFGDLGLAVHSFLTGILGYFAYPTVLGAFYLSIMGLIGKRFVKNRRLFACIAVTLVFISLIVHTSLTFSWERSGYLAACFQAGENFPAATATGWLGGLIVFGVSAVMSNIGAIVMFSLLTVFSLYLCVLSVRNPNAPKKAKEPKTKPTVKAERAPQSAEKQASFGQASNYEPAPSYNAQPSMPIQNGYAAPKVVQRPGVRLSEEAPLLKKEAPAHTGAFSPFGTTETMQETPASTEHPFENSRAFLFGGSASENYKRNLIFDPNSSANKRSREETDPISTGEYTPSYSDAYQNSINDKTENERPVKIVNDNTYGAYQADTAAVGGYDEAELERKPILPMQPMEEERPVYQEPVSYLSYEEPTVPVAEEPIREESFGFAREEEPQTPAPQEEGYRRHNYMDLFSPSNPNLFGGAETSANKEDIFSDRTADRNSFSEERGGFGVRGFSEEPADDFTRESRNVEEERGRNGLNIFDEPEDDPYNLRSEFDDDLGSRDTGRNDRSFTSDRDFGVSDRSFERSAPSIPEPMKREPKIEPPKSASPPKPRVIKPYKRVPLDDFDCRDVEPTSNDEEVWETKENIIATLEDFKVTGASIASVTFGPTVTRYNVTLPRSISPRKVVALDQSIAISLHSSGVNIYPNYEDGVVSIEVPNKERQFVNLGCMLSGDTFVNAKSSSLMFTMGKNVANAKIYGDISKMIHLLVAGSSGSGKSVFLGALIVSMIYKYSPEELRLILIDPKKTEFVLYNNLPHLMINEIITDVNKAVQSLNWAIGEMNRRYSLFEQMSRAGTYVVNLDQYNAQLEKAQRLPKIVIIIDELADLMLAAKKEMEDRIQNLTQKARAAGIHLIVATQRPSTDVITGVIKSNLPTRIAFYVATDVDSRVILDQSGAQKLLGKGDFLYTMPGINTPVRVQSAFISPEDSQKVVNFIKANNEAYYDEEATAYINNSRMPGDDSLSDKTEVDPMYIEALRYVILSGSASISMIQRKCSAGYNRAGKIIEWMEDMGYISAFDGAKARKVLITKEEFESKYGPLQ